MEVLLLYDATKIYIHLFVILFPGIRIWMSSALAEIEEPDYDKILYGGIIPLKKRYTEEEYRHIVQFAVNDVFKRNPDMIVVDEKSGAPENPDILNFEAVQLVFTADNHEAFLTSNEVNAEDTDGAADNSGEKYTQQISSVLVFGITSTLWLRWEKRNLNIVFIHKFVITEYPRRQWNIYSHIYHEAPIKGNETKQNSGDSESTPVIGKSSSTVITQQATCDKFLGIPFIEHLPCCPIDFTGNGRSVLRDHTSLYQLNGKPRLTFKVLTFNIWNMNSYAGTDSGYIKRMAKLGQTCIRIGADIIAFQEVRYEYSKGGKLGPNQVKHLADMLPGYQYMYQPAQLQSNSLMDGRTEEGIAIFSKYPIVQHNFLLLFRNMSNSADTHQRICLHIEVSLADSTTVHILTTHLSLSHEAREQSVVQIWRYIQTLKGGVILLGDFNAEPTENAIRFLHGAVTLEAQRSYGLEDLWVKLNGSEPAGVTFSSLTNKLTKRIDYIFMRKHPQFKATDITVIDDRNRGELAASDHIPVMATVAFVPHED